MTRRQTTDRGRRQGAWGLFLLLCALGGAAGPAHAAEAEGAARKPRLRLKAKSIVFSRAMGDIELEGDVHVTRTTADGVLTVTCDRMTAKMKDGRMRDVLAVGLVTLVSDEYRAEAARATFDFEANVIRLYGEEGSPARVDSPGMWSTGPEIIFHLKDERVELPKGGETVVDLDSAPEPE